MFNSSLHISKYKFTLEAIDEIILPAYKGSTFHGGFGRALMSISPLWFRYFFEAGIGDKGDWPKPFVILPPLDTLETYPKGHQFQCEVTLFGEASQHYAIAQAAIEYLGLTMGLGKNNGKYKVLDIVQLSYKQQDEISSPTQHIRLTFPTRLRLKANNRLHKQPPEFSLIIARLLGRLKTLENAYLPQKHEQHSEQDLKEKSKYITLKSHNIHWDDWHRFSGSQKEWMQFGGLMGDISYEGDLLPFIELLSLGEWLHIGGKTSFGLGKYTLEINANA